MHEIRSSVKIYHILLVKLFDSMKRGIPCMSIQQDDCTAGESLGAKSVNQSNSTFLGDL